MDTNWTLSESEIENALTFYASMPEEKLFRQVLPAFSGVLYEGGLSGEREESAIERFYNERFLPSLRAASRKNYQIAKDILATIEKNHVDVTTGLASLIGQYLVDMMQLPQPNERKLIIGFSVILMYIALKAKQKEP